ncbi:MAG TPA: CocE/NonD family hydrolase [Frankiaceae bacterium]|nr:CocE/NonD family hydrolase [Frankiaceae bacterium]
MSRRTRPRPLRLLLVAGTALAVAAGSVHAAPARQPARVFDPRPRSAERYDTADPSADPRRQRTYVKAADGVRLFVETWLPAPLGGRVPPKRIPTVLIMTPYVKMGVKRYTGTRTDIAEYFTSRGYAVAQAHVRGTGESGGCLEQTARKQIDDGARIVEYLGRDAPWSNGRVGMYGISYDGETQISVAGLGDPRRTKYLKAIVPVASVSGQYEYSAFDGVPYAGQALGSNATYLGGVSARPGDTSSAEQYAAKATCQPEIVAGSADQSGDMTPYWMAREYRAGASRIKAATLYVHGLTDFNVQPIAMAGMLDRIPASTPRAGLVGVWPHAFPDHHPGVRPEWERGDWLDMVTAWYDRYLKGLPTGVESWPRVQVQSSDGRWRAERDFPGTGGPVGQLALSAGGTLGSRDPSGSSSFVESDPLREPPTAVRFETPKVRAPLHLTGQPVLDLWVSTDRPDGHLAAELTVYGADGVVLRHTGSDAQALSTYGFRSLRHTQPIRENWFRQTTPNDVPLVTPVRVQVRFHPTDLVVPVGGRLRLTISGVLRYSRTSSPSGTAARITVSHDCDAPSVLRFVTPRPDATLLGVRLKHQGGAPRAPRVARRSVDGGGLASGKVCGRPPLRLDAFRPSRDLVGR